jgi:tRNA (mo5U34)-methyltransferase
VSAPDIHGLRWYHTIDLPDGSATPGEYDLRGISGSLPWPASMAGMRCLDVGSRDGFYAFEMERRGAAEVVSLDIGDPADLDFPGGERPPADLVEKELADGHAAFSAAAEALGSKVERRLKSAYDLSQDEFGTFDFAVIGTLLLHLRDPVRALRGVRSVLSGRLLLNDPVTPGLLSLIPIPSAELLMRRGPFWWICNPAGQRRLVEAAGFKVVGKGRPYLVPYGAGYERPSVGRTLSERPFRTLPRRLVQRRGALHAWTLGDASS